MQKYLITSVIGILILGGLLFIYFRAETPSEDLVPVSEKSESLDTPPDIFEKIENENKFLPTPKPSEAPKIPAAVQSKDQGRVVFAVTDDAVNLEALQSLILTISEVSVFHPTKGWVTVSNSPKHFDLFRLYRNPVLEVLADIMLDSATYSQIRLTVARLALVDKNGNLSEVKLPSSEIKINTHLVVTKEGNSSAVIDFLADKSLFTTGSGKYIFLPVLKVETRSMIETVQIFSGRVDFIGGRADFDSSFGADEKGNLQMNFKFDASAKFEIEGENIRIVPR